jgi:hypothetical protein
MTPAKQKKLIHLLKIFNFYELVQAKFLRFCQMPIEEYMQEYGELDDDVYWPSEILEECFNIAVIESDGAEHHLEDLKHIIRIIQTNEHLTEAELFSFLASNGVYDNFMDAVSLQYNTTDPVGWIKTELSKKVYPDISTFLITSVILDDRLISSLPKAEQSHFSDLFKAESLVRP